MKTLEILQKAAFLSLLVCGSGDSWANLVGVIISLAVFCLTTFKLKRYGL